MTTDTLTLTAFFLERIEEDEARAASDIDHFCDPNDNADKWITMYAKRLAAECAAKRAIVERGPVCDDDDCGDRDCMVIREDWRILASVYAGHDDYRADWAL